MTSLLLLTLIVSGDPSAPAQEVVVVVGAPGSDEFGEQFEQWSQRWEAAASTNCQFQRIGLSDALDTSDREHMKQALSSIVTESTEPLWLVLIGHGTYDGQQAKFNLRGPDVTASELKEWLDPIKRPTVVINCASSSSPFLNELSAANRVIVTATKSGYEQNFARFGDHISAAITDPAADLDKDNQISLLEAFLAASSRVSDFYKQESRLVTEHALLDDNGDGLGTSADWFRGVRAIGSAKDGARADGLRAHQIHLVRSPSEVNLTPEARTQRDRIERDIEQLRQRKGELTENDYYNRLEELLLELATLYADVESKD